MRLWPGKRRADVYWEVVDSKSVDPVRMYDDDDDELGIIGVSPTMLSASYVFNLEAMRSSQPGRSGQHSYLQGALLKTRHRLLQEAARIGYNILLLEGWTVTLLRKHTTPTLQHPLYRISVRYTGRPACVHVARRRPPPPFLSLLHDWGEQARREYIHDEEDDIGLAVQLESRQSDVGSLPSPLPESAQELEEVKSGWSMSSVMRKLRTRKEAVSLHVLRFISFQFRG